MMSASAAYRSERRAERAIDCQRSRCGNAVIKVSSRSISNRSESVKYKDATSSAGRSASSLISIMSSRENTSSSAAAVSASSAGVPSRSW